MNNESVVRRVVMISLRRWRCWCCSGWMWRRWSLVVLVCCWLWIVLLGVSWWMVLVERATADEAV